MIFPRCFAAILFVALSGCAGPVIKTVDKGASYPDRFDGALINYFLARGEITATASYSKESKLLTVTLGDQIKAIPDFNHRHTLAYAHGALSTDEIAIELDNGLLKKVSSTSTDQTVDAVKAINALMTQTASTLAAFAQTTTSAPRAAARTAAATCEGDMKSTAIKDVTFNAATRLSRDKITSDQCYIDISVTVTPRGVLGLAGFPQGSNDTPSEDICNEAVCFRMTGAYTVTATAVIRNASAADQGQAQKATADILAPHATNVGFVRFDRRRFVANTTTVTFSNGMVSGFAAKDPSEVVGFLTLPTEILKGVAIAVQF